MAAPPSYLSIAAFRVRTTMLGEDVDRLEAVYPGFLQAQIDDESSWIAGRLRKRYAVEGFDANPPGIVLKWLNKIVTLEAFDKRGFDSLSPEGQRTITASETARAEVKEAAESVEGLFDLPLRNDSTASGISQGGPLGYAEASPYTANDRQREAIESNGE